MFFSLSSLISVVFLCGLLIIVLSFYLQDTDRMAQTGVRSILILMGIIAMRLIFPLEFTFSTTFPSRYIMTNLMKFLHRPIISVLNENITILNVMFFVWVIGIIITVASTIRTYMRFGQIIKKLPVLHDSKVDEILHTITQVHKKPVLFQVVYSELISTPMLYGIHRPKIMVPAIDLTYSEWYFILKHETMHYYNRDLHIKLLVQLLRIIYWWNPFVYLLNSEIDKMLEIRVDSDVTENLNEYKKTEYLDCLLKVAKNGSLERSHSFSVSFDSGRASVLFQRFSLIGRSYKPSDNNRLSTIILTVMLVSLLYTSFTAVFEPYSIPTDVESYTVELTEKNSYLVENQSGGYDVYCNEEYFCTVNSMKDAFSNFIVYKNIEEVKRK